MKIAILSDVHLGPSGYYKGVRRKLTEFSEEFISNFVERVSSDNQYSFAVHLGDLIQDADPASDRENIRKALGLFRKCSRKLYHLIGNHDVKYLALSEVLSELQYERPYYSFDHGAYHFVVLFSEVPNQSNQRSVIPAEQVSWLAKDLGNTQQPTIIFCHHSLADQDVTGNPWFDSRPDACLIENRVEVREVICRHDNVLCVINGHVHWNRIDIHSRVPFITIQSATENFRDDGTPANSWAELELSNETIAINIHGNDSMRFEIPTSKRTG